MERHMYFAYGSNMNLDQMNFRCPNAEVIGAVRLEDYKLAFCGATLHGVATILPAEGEHVDGVLWAITEKCEQSLDSYEGYPNLYGKQMITVEQKDGTKVETMVYVMNEPYKNHQAKPSPTYLRGILEGCRENGVPTDHVLGAVGGLMLAGRERKQKETELRFR